MLEIHRVRLDWVCPAAGDFDAQASGRNFRARTTIPQDAKKCGFLLFSQLCDPAKAPCGTEPRSIAGGFTRGAAHAERGLLI